MYRLMMPLVVPSDVVNLSWSERMGGGSRKFRVDERDALEQAIGAAFTGLSTDDTALRQVLARGMPLGANSRVNEMVGYTQVLLGDLEAAQKSLACARGGPTVQAWEQAIVDRAQLIADLLRSQGRDGAIAQLDKWRDATAGALGLR